ncbi:MAG TPA: hypothetical protein VFI49_03885 [Rudaea sp.]|nr:hypothetical protein [Rudaea sp.]
MKHYPLLFGIVLVLVAGCDDHFHTLWHGEKLPSGGMVKVTSFNLVWGIEHDDRNVAQDSFAIEYVTAYAGADANRREAEAADVFAALVRPASEQWGFREASLAAFPTLQRKGRYDLYLFQRGSDGTWSYTRSEPKVFAND